MTELYSGPMKTAVSIPDSIFEAADRLAKRRRVSRSELYADALRRLLADEDDQNITARLDAIYADAAVTIDPLVELEQARFLSEDSW